MISAQALWPQVATCLDRRLEFCYSEGMEFLPFDSFDAVQQAMREAEDAANAQLSPEQRELLANTDTPRYWIQFHDNFAIYGHCWSDAQVRASSEKYSSDPEEIENEVQSVREARTRGYLFGQAWSAPYPEGELGSTHVSQVQPISQEMFDAARKNGWKV